MLSGLYFPWVLIKDMTTLKKALIYFDNVTLMCPSNLSGIQKDILSLDDWHGTQLLRKLAQEAIDFLQSCEPLINAGILKLIDPKIVVDTPEENQIFYKSVYSDITSPNFYTGSNDLEVFIKDNVIIDVGPGGWTFDNYYNFDFHSLAEQLQNDIYEEIKKLNPGFRSMLKQYWREHQIESFGTEYVGKSVIINKTILASHKFGGIPFTDDPLHIEALYDKYQAIDSDNHHTSIAFQNWRCSSSMKESMQAFNIINLVLPNANTFTIEDILEIREKLKDELINFRTEVGSLTAKLESNILYKDIILQINRQTKVDVLPTIEELKRKISLTNDKILLKVFQKLKSPEPLIPFAITAFTPLPLYAALLISAGLITFETALETYVDRKEIKNSTGLSYLLNFKSRLKIKQRHLKKDSLHFD